MKKLFALLLSVSLLFSLSSSAWAEEAAKEGQEAPAEEAVQQEAAAETDEAGEELQADSAEEPETEWNVLLYLCGTDLESKGGCASLNLNAIAGTIPNGKVNLLVETGGAKKWDPEGKLDFEIANDKLQRWYYGEDGFVLVDEAEDACMSDSRTLSDFIHWSAENFTAKKNLLLLWDHGGGSSRGLILDENYDNTIMPVFSLEKALRDGGTHFDLVLTDTCLMASLEMCQALAPYADYLVASEEVMAGDGTNYKGWVQYLYDRPDCTPVQVGKRICDYTQQYYIEKEDPLESKFFTMSLIDLSRIDEVAESFNLFIHSAADLIEDPDAFFDYARETNRSENYLLETMYDIFDLSRRAELAGIPQELTHPLQDAVEDAVVYNLRSDYHMYSHGLSVYYPLHDEKNDLDHFARTCKNPEHLAFLDSIVLNWDAPDWVYETADKHPELDRSAYIVAPEVIYSEDGSDAYLTLSSGEKSALHLVYELYYKDAEYGVMYTLGQSGNLDPEKLDESGSYRFRLGFDGTWPSMNGTPLCINIADETDSYILYDVPVKYKEDDMSMRILVNQKSSNQEENSESGSEAVEAVISEESSEDSAEAGTEDSAEEEQLFVNNEQGTRSYELLGLWDGFDAHTGLPGRNIIPLKEVDGNEVTMYNVIYSKSLDKVSDLIERENVVLNKDAVIERGKLPEGEYMIRFMVKDIFNTVHYSDYFNVHWDGETVTFPDSDKKS